MLETEMCFIVFKDPSLALRQWGPEERAGHTVWGVYQGRMKRTPNCLVKWLRDEGHTWQMSLTESHASDPP